MHLKTHTFLIVALFSIFVFAEYSAAQLPWRARGPLNRHHRFAGAFHSDGYHTATRGPSVGYYNPYSNLNTSRFNNSAYGYQGNGFSYPTPVYQYHQPQTFHSAPRTAPGIPGTHLQMPTPVPPQKPVNPAGPIQPKVPPQKSPSDDTTMSGLGNKVRLQNPNTNTFSKKLESVLQIK